MKTGRMRRFAFALSVLFLGGCGGKTDSAADSATGIVTVTIRAGASGTAGTHSGPSLGPAAYGANPLRLPVGSKVVWNNADALAHTATSDTGLWDTGTIAPGATSAPMTFDAAGTFPYFCTLHGAAAMSGTLVVQ